MKRLYAAVFGLLFSTLLTGGAAAQQTIFNVPTTDVLDKGKVYVKLDAALKFNDRHALSGISANTLWYNSTIGMAMLLGRFFIIIPVLAIAGNLARKKAVPPSLGTFPVTTPLFTILLVSIIVIVGALTFFPVLLGPIVEDLLMSAGQTF